MPGRGMGRMVRGEMQGEAMNVFCFSQRVSFSVLAVGDKDMRSHLFIYKTVYVSLYLPQNTPQLIWHTHVSSAPHPLEGRHIVLQSSICLCLHCSCGLLFTDDLPGSFSRTPTLPHHTLLTLSEFLSTFILVKLPQTSSIISEHSSDFPAQISKCFLSLYPK